MTVLSIQRDMAPERGPNIVRIETDDFVENIVQPNWLLDQKEQITRLNEGDFEWRLNDVLLINFVANAGIPNRVDSVQGANFFYLTADFTTVIPMAPIYPNLQNVVAHAGGGQANATQLNIGINVVVTVATAGDSLKLPVNVLGQTVVVTNRTLTSANIYPSLGDEIDNLGPNNPIVLASGVTAVFYGTEATKWNSK